MERPSEQQGVFVVDFNDTCVKTTTNALTAVGINTSPTNLVIENPEYQRYLRYLSENPMLISSWRPDTGIEKALNMLHRRRRVILASSFLETARDPLEYWLQKHGLRQYIDEIELRSSPEISPPKSKAALFLHFLLSEIPILGVFDNDIKVLMNAATERIPSYLIDLYNPLRDKHILANNPIGPFPSLRYAVFAALLRTPGMQGTLDI